VGNYARQPRMATRILAPVPEAAVQFVRRRAMGDRRFSSSTPGRDPVVDRSWRPLEPGQAAVAQSSGSRSCGVNAEVPLIRKKWRYDAQSFDLRLHPRQLDFFQPETP
jgi:hypothetical protein